MDKFEIINSLVRLSAIAEEIEEESPGAANSIDSFVDDAADQIGGEGGVPDKNLFPPVNTPVLPSGGQAAPDNRNFNQEQRSEVKEIQEDQRAEQNDLQDLARLITDEIEGSSEFQKLLPLLHTEEGGMALNALIEKQIKQVLPEAA